MYRLSGKLQSPLTVINRVRRISVFNLPLTMSSRRSSARLAAKDDPAASSDVSNDTSQKDSSSLQQPATADGRNPRKPAASGTTLLPERGAAKSREMNDEMPKPPETPNKKKRKPSVAKAAEQLPPATPTPADVSVLASSVPQPSTPDAGASPSKRRRKAAPHATNAPLQTPKGSKLVAYPSELFESTQEAQAFDRAEGVLTTENLLDKACEHLISVDPRMKKLVEAHRCPMFSPEGLAEVVDPFVSLVSGIIGQQVRHRPLVTLQLRAGMLTA